MTGSRMYDHVHRMVLVGTTTAPAFDTSDSLVTRLRPTGFERYTGLVVFTPDVRLAVLEGPVPLAVLHRHALMLAGLNGAQTLLAQRTSFRWFSALLVQQHEAAPPGFSMAELSALSMLPPRNLCNHMATLARLGEHAPQRAAGNAARSEAAA